MKTVQYLKNYAYSYIYVILAILLATLGLSNAATYVSSAQKFSEQTVIVIDPGHGGMDGGTVSNTGISESQINLQISLRLQELMKLLGQEPIMTRTSDKSLGEDHGTVRQQKRSDLQYRVDTVNALEHALLISIHQNYFTQTQYSGPQVFSAKDPNSIACGELFQNNMNRILVSGKGRSCKRADGIYLMENIVQPGILIECGFLSNPTEAKNLQTEEYQKKICAVLAASAMEYLAENEIS